MEGFVRAESQEFGPSFGQTGRLVVYAFLWGDLLWSTTGWRDVPCAQEGRPGFVSYALRQVLFHLVKFMYGDGLEEHSKSAVKTFYLQNGELITTSKPSCIGSMRSWMAEAVKAKNS